MEEGRLREGRRRCVLSLVSHSVKTSVGRSKKNSLLLTCKSASPIRPAPRFGRPTRPSTRRPLPPRTPRRGGGARGVSASVPPPSSMIPSRWRSTSSASSLESNASRSRRRSRRPSTWAWTPPPIGSCSLRLEVGRPPSRGETLGAASSIEGRSKRYKQQRYFFCEQKIFCYSPDSFPLQLLPLFCLSLLLALPRRRPPRRGSSRRSNSRSLRSSSSASSPLLGRRRRRDSGSGGRRDDDGPAALRRRRLPPRSARCPLQIASSFRVKRDLREDHRVERRAQRVRPRHRFS